VFSIPVCLEEIGMVIDIIKLHVEKNMCMLISEKGGFKMHRVKKPKCLAGTNLLAYFIQQSNI
jgi:hypothetical protein